MVDSGTPKENQDAEMAETGNDDQSLPSEKGKEKIYSDSIDDYLVDYPSGELPANASVQETETEAHYPPDLNYYRLREKISRGSGANVFKGFRKPDESSVVAVKLISLQQPHLRFDTPYPGFDREAEHAVLPSHPNLLPRPCSFVLDNHAARWVVMPFIAGGSLQSIIASSYTNGIPDKFLSPILKKILSALAHLHKQGLFHGNIKAGNVLLDSNGCVMLSDSGISASIYQLLPAAVVATFPDKLEKAYWSAPEVGEHVYSYVGYGDKAEIWSFGVTALELAIGRPPLSQLPYHRINLMLEISERFRFHDPNELSKHSKKVQPKLLSECFKNMVEGCLHPQPSKRPSVDELLNHPFFREGDGDDILIKKLLEGVPPIEHRFKEWTGHSRDRDYLDKAIGGRITRWKFDKERFEFDPADVLEAHPPTVAEKRKVIEDLVNTGADSVEGIRLMNEMADDDYY